MRVGRCVAIAVLASALNIASLAAAHAAVNCSFTAAPGVNFGSYNVFNASPTLSNGSLTFNCTGVGAGSVAVTIALNRGIHSPIFPNRDMANGAQLLGYNLYQDAALTIIWGNGNHGTVVESATAFNNTPVTLTIYGQIFAGQDVTAGGYSDTITATITF